MWKVVCVTKLCGKDCAFDKVVCVCVDHLNRCKTSNLQGATLPVTREWPTKSLVSGTENVPAFCCPWAPACAAWRQIYIYIYIYVSEPFLCLALWNQNELGSFVCLAHWKQSHSCVWLFGTKMNPGPFLRLALWNQKWTLCHSCVWPIGNKTLSHSCVWLFGSDHQVYIYIFILFSFSC